MPGLVPGIHVLAPKKAWMAGTSPAMTEFSFHERRSAAHRRPFAGARERRHHLAREAPQVVARAGRAVEQYVLDAAGPQRGELLGELVGRAEHRALLGAFQRVSKRQAGLERATRRRG